MSKESPGWKMVATVALGLLVTVAGGGYWLGSNMATTKELTEVKETLENLDDSVNELMFELRFTGVIRDE